MCAVIIRGIRTFLSPGIVEEINVFKENCFKPTGIFKLYQMPLRVMPFFVLWRHEATIKGNKKGKFICNSRIHGVKKGGLREGRASSSGRLHSIWAPGYNAWSLPCSTLNCVFIQGVREMR